MWIGSGLAGIDGLQAGDPVTAEQMQALFGVGLHPLAMQRQHQLHGPDLADRDYLAVSRLGAPFKIYANDIPPFRVEVAKRIAEVNSAAGLPRDWPVPRRERARIRTEVATELFTAEHGRPPQDARELAAAIAKHSRPQTTAVAGHDLTFSPVKVCRRCGRSPTRRLRRGSEGSPGRGCRRVELHQRHALFSRTGAAGFGRSTCKVWLRPTHTPRQPRGDPDLHTRGRCQQVKPSTDAGSASTAILFRPRSRRAYNTALSSTSATVSGSDSPSPDQDRKRPIREIVGVAPP